MWLGNKPKLETDSLKLYVYENQAKWFGKGFVRFGSRWLGVCEAIGNSEAECLETLQNGCGPFVESEKYKSRMFKALVAATRCSPEFIEWNLRNNQ